MIHHNIALQLFMNFIVEAIVFHRSPFFSVARLAQTHIAPHVREMEAEGKIKDSVIKILFENGVNKTKI